MQPCEYFYLSKKICTLTCSVALFWKILSLLHEYRVCVTPTTSGYLICFWILLLVYIWVWNNSSKSPVEHLVATLLRLVVVVSHKREEEEVQ